MSYQFKPRLKSGPKKTDDKRRPFFPKAPLVQTKLEIGEPGDKYEQEADAVAEKVVNQQSQTPSGLQRMSGEEEEPVQMQTAEEREEGVRLKSEQVETSESELEEGVNLKEAEEEEEAVQMAKDPEMEEEAKEKL